MGSFALYVVGNRRLLADALDQNLRSTQTLLIFRAHIYECFASL